MTEPEIRAMCTLAGIEVLRVWQLPNGYVGVQEPLTDNEITRDTHRGLDCGYRYVVSDKESTEPTVNVVRAWMQDYTWRYNRPAWLIKTQFGLIQITPRKRVDDLDWRETPIRCIVTEDDVTKSDTNVHAYTDEKMIQYLKAWKIKADRQVQTGTTV